MIISSFKSSIMMTGCFSSAVSIAMSTHKYPIIFNKLLDADHNFNLVGAKNYFHFRPNTRDAFALVIIVRSEPVSITALTLALKGWLSLPLDSRTATGNRGGPFGGLNGLFLATPVLSEFGLFTSREDSIFEQLSREPPSFLENLNNPLGDAPLFHNWHRPDLSKFSL